MALLLGVLLLQGGPVADAPWPLDEVVLKNGVRFRGLVLKDTSPGIDFQVVRRSPGRPTVTLTTYFARREIDHVKPLAEADRAALREKLAGLDPTGAGEQQRMDALTLTSVEWRGKPNAAARYESDQFALVSGAPEEVTRRAAVRLEQIYAAFARVLPPRHEGRRTQVILAGQMDDYAALVGAVRNPAVYDPATNRVVCGSDLRRLGEELAVAQKAHAKELARLDKYEAEVRVLYKGQKAELDRHLATATKERQRIYLANHSNGVKFDKATRRLFALLYHEAFHSYTATFVYPPRTADEVRAGQGTGELPRWLNEGLAQVFETATVEGGELRVGLPDPERLDRVQDLLRPRNDKVAGLVPLGDLLRAGQETFLAQHAAQQSAADRAYLTSWGLAHYLTFERRVVGSKELEAYLTDVNGGGNPVKAFEDWVGMPTAAFERELAEYLTRLRPDGTRLPAKKPEK